jgi:hypothetical protein
MNASALNRRVGSQTFVEGRRKEDSPSMPGSPVTWVIAGAVAALVVVAAVDALRSSPPPAAQATATTRTSSSTPTLTTLPAFSRLDEAEIARIGDTWLRCTLPRAQAFASTWRNASAG